jgi:hypothetical protein
VSCPTENQYKINLPSERKSVKIYVAGIAVQTTNWSESALIIILLQRLSNQISNQSVQKRK